MSGGLICGVSGFGANIGPAAATRNGILKGMELRSSNVAAVTAVPVKHNTVSPLPA